MATKRPENPYDGLLSALFKDASEAIKDTTKKTPSDSDTVPDQPAHPPLSLIAGGGEPSPTPETGDTSAADAMTTLDGQAKRRVGGAREASKKARERSPGVLRIRDLGSNRRTVSPQESDLGKAAPTSPPPQAAGDVSDETPGEGQRGYHTPSDFTIYPLTEFQRQVLLFLVQKEKSITAMREIAAHTGISYNSIRKILKVLFANRLIIKDEMKFVSGKFQGFRYSVNGPACQKALEDRSGCPNGRPMEGSAEPLEAGDVSFLVSHLEVQGAEIYPNLHAIGLRRKDFIDIVQCWKAQSHDLTRMADSLEAADWDLAHNGDGHIQTPATYIRKALKSGPYTFPKGFKSRRQIQAEQDARIAEACRKHMEKVINDCFVLWWTPMDAEEKRQVDAEIGKTNRMMSSMGDGQKELLRQQYFRDHVYSADLKDRLFREK